MITLTTESIYINKKKRMRSEHKKLNVRNEQKKKKTGKRKLK